MTILRDASTWRRWIFCVTVISSACTQFPTENQYVTDLRPQLSFKILKDGLGGAAVFVDGLVMGTAGEFAEGIASLRVLPGNHQIRVDINGTALVDEKIYMGDGVHRTILVR